VEPLAAGSGEEERRVLGKAVEGRPEAVQREDAGFSSQRGFAEDVREDRGEEIHVGDPQRARTLRRDKRFERRKEEPAVGLPPGGVVSGSRIEPLGADPAILPDGAPEELGQKRREARRDRPYRHDQEPHQSLPLWRPWSLILL